jgi:hypothetical protein
MGADVSRTAHQVLIVPEHSLTVWDDESTGLTEASPAAGIPTPTSTTHLALTATGDQAGDRRVRAQQPGLPLRNEDAGRFITRGEADTDWQGWDPPRGPSSWQSILWNDSDITALEAFDVTTTEGQAVVVVAELRDVGAVATYRLEAITRSATTGTWSRVAIETSSTPWPQALCPTVVALPSGRLQVYRVLNGTFYGRLQVYRVLNGTFYNRLRMWFSDDEGATWTHGGDLSPNTGGIVRMRAAYSDGQLLIGIRNATGVTYLSSSDEGHTFEVTGGMSGSGGRNFDVCAAPGGGFLFAVIAEDDTAGVDVVLLPDAYTLASNATTVSLPAEFASVTADEEVTIAVDGGGVVTCIARDGAHTFAAVSYDGGGTWSIYETDAASTEGDVLCFVRASTSSYPNAFCMTPVGGRMALVSTHTSAGTTPSGVTLGCYLLGGWTTKTTPSWDAVLIDRYALGWSQVWYPVEQPAAGTDWTAVNTGAGPTLLFELNAVKSVATTLNHGYWRSSTLTSGNAAVRFAVSVAAGSTTTSQVAVRLALASCEVTVQCSSTGYRVVDGSAVQIGTVAVNMSSPGAPVQIWVEVDNSTRAVTVYHRTYDHGEERTWSAGASGTLSSTTPAARVVEWGNLATPSVGQTVWWHELAYADDASRRTSGASFDDLPADLRGRLFSGAPYIGDDVRLSAVHGPAYRGEEWTIATTAHHRIEQVLERSSPRIGWRSTSTGAQTIALQWDSAATPGQRSVLALMLRGSNLPQVSIDGHNGTGWVSLASNLDLTLGALDFSRVGSGVKPAAGSGATPWLRHGDYQGSTFCMSTTVARRIARHGEGRWDSTANLQPVLRLVDVDSGDPTSGAAATIIPEQVVVLLELGADLRAIRLVIPAAASTYAPAENYWQIGTLVAGWAYPFGYVPDWGRRIITELPNEVIETRDRQRRITQTAPAVRSMSLAWSAAIDQTPVEADDAVEPDWVAVDSTADASARGTAYVLDGIMREVHGALGELVLMPRVPVLTGVDVFTRRRDALHGRIAQELTRETVIGDEHVDEVVRVNEVTIEEIV